ncbi:hypothetical protein OIU77_001336 [Salix suchowensis]|uniref:Glutamate--ammonia ligase n=1 Tax=Salix suchowensis TaxID=1278906 RepID=A0ABQ9B135_9ROSI|nr:hypothetical protein OIU77_001336 [Salix suchowensis]
MASHVWEEIFHFYKLFSEIHVGGPITSLTKFCNIKPFSFSFSFSCWTFNRYPYRNELWAARYILERITEVGGVVLSYLILSELGSIFISVYLVGCCKCACFQYFYCLNSHEIGLLFCQGEWGRTQMTGYEVIEKAIEKVGLRHKEHISACGQGKVQRLTGLHETADICFCFNMDPYVLTSMIAETTILRKP